MIIVDFFRIRFSDFVDFFRIRFSDFVGCEAAFSAVE